MIYVTADPHFSHQGILKHRNFISVEHMNEYLIAQWNSTVMNKNDDIYIIGDFCFAGKEKGTEILKRLRGRKHLVLGNHDNYKISNSKDDFQSVTHYKKLKYEKKKFILFHYPIYSWESMYKGSIHLHGHVHTGEHREDKKLKNKYNVGVDVNSFKPIAITDFIQEEYNVNYKIDGLSSLTECLNNYDYKIDKYIRVGSARCLTECGHFIKQVDDNNLLCKCIPKLEEL